MPIRVSSVARSAFESEYRRTLKLRRMFKFRRPARALPPVLIERLYGRLLERVMMRAQVAIKLNIIERLQEIAAAAKAGRFIRPDGSEMIVDEEAADLIAELLAKTTQSIEASYSPFEQRTVAEEIAYQTANFNKEQLNKVFRSVLTVDLVSSEPYLKGEIAAFVAENVGLIKSLPAKLVEDVGRIVYAGVRTGDRWETMAQEIQDRFRVSDNRARLIARDQVNKFNGALSRVRQQKAGFERYRWETSQDERVRPEHAARHGKIFKWDEPPDDGNPGEPINCRCWATPVFEDLL